MAGLTNRLDQLKFHFYRFLESDTFIRVRHDPEVLDELFSGQPRNEPFGPEPGVFDVIELWLVFGDAARLCPTFDCFVFAILDIVEDLFIEAACGDLDSKFGTQVAGTTLWPHGHVGGNVPGFTLLELSRYRTGLDPRTSVSRHPVLDHHRFEMHQARIRREDQQKLLDVFERKS